MKYLKRPPLDVVVQKAFSACIQHHWLWDKPGGFSQRFPTEKAILKNQLLGMQFFCCAYCGAKLTEKDQFGFIEHFERREGKIGPTYDWSNLFVSCQNPESCGIWKDTKGKHVPLSQVLKPDDEAVIGRFRYLPNGQVAAVKAGDAAADNTIVVFNLNTPKLASRRKKLMEGLASVLQVYAVGETDEELVACFCEEMGFEDCAMWWLRKLRSKNDTDRRTC